MKKTEGTVDEFRTKTCYGLYMYAVGLAKQVNDYIDKGWLVSRNGEALGRFIFRSMGEPCIAEEKGNCSLAWFGSFYDSTGKVWLHGDVTKKIIREKFEEIIICNPKLMTRLNYV